MRNQVHEPVDLISLTVTLVPRFKTAPPFETKETLEKRLKDLYAEVRVSPVRAEGVFCCVK